MKKSQAMNLSDGFRRWSVVHPSAANADDYPGGASSFRKSGLGPATARWLEMRALAGSANKF